MNVWRNAGGDATITDSVADYFFAAATPHAGISASPHRNHLGPPGPRVGQLFGLAESIGYSLHRTEHYVRENQLISWFEPTEGRPIEVLALYRHCPVLGDWIDRDGLSWIELVLSLQTSLLEAHPSISVNFTLEGVARDSLEYLKLASTWARPDGEPVASEQETSFQGMLVRRGAAGLMIGVDPNDLLQWNINFSETALHGQAQLRCGRLEKGVIRRFRLLFSYSATGRLDALRQLANTFVSSQLPLSN